LIARNVSQSQSCLNHIKDYETFDYDKDAIINSLINKKIQEKGFDYFLIIHYECNGCEDQEKIDPRS